MGSLSGGQICIHNLWYHHAYGWLSVHVTATYRCDDTRGCAMQFWPPHDEHMCSKHVEAWNKLIVKQILCIKLVKYWDKMRTLSDDIYFQDLSKCKNLQVWYFTPQLTRHRAHNTSQKIIRNFIWTFIFLPKWRIYCFNKTEKNFC